MSPSWFDRVTQERLRPVPRGRRRRNAVRPQIEGLETRLALSVSSVVVNGQLQVNGSAADTITLDHLGSNTLVNGMPFADTSITAGIRVSAGTGNNTVNLLANSKPVTL